MTTEEQSDLAKHLRIRAARILATNKEVGNGVEELAALAVSWVVVHNQDDAFMKFIEEHTP
jgi:hypothetical protein